MYLLYSHSHTMLLPILFAFFLGMLITVLLMFAFVNYFLATKIEKNYEHIRQTSAAARAFAAAAVSNARSVASNVVAAIAPRHGATTGSSASDALADSDQYTVDTLPVLRTGWMKIRGSLKVWRDRFFVLSPGLLIYYKNDRVRASRENAPAAPPAAAADQ